MEKYNLTQTGQEVQDILNNSTPQSELTAETERAQEAERLLGEGIQQNADDIDAIEGKIPSAATSENKLTDKEYVDGQIDAEKARAQGAESTLQDNIDAEEARATEAEQTLQGNIDAEEARATEAEQSLQGNIDAEATRIYALEEKVPSGASASNKLATEEYVNESVATAIDAEEERAQEAESTLQDDIDAEEDRAQEAESTLQNYIEEEEERAKAAERQNADDIDALEAVVPVDATTENKLATISDVTNEANARETADNSLSSAIEAILLLIPSAATSLNKLADKDFVNSSISAASATFRGTYNLVSDLRLTVSATRAQIALALNSSVAVKDNNDYVFVQIPTADATPTQIAKTERFKYNGTIWEYEYDLNNSGYTSAQWAAINSGITEALVNKLSDLPMNADLTTALGVLTRSITTINQKIPETASQANKLVDTAAMESYIVQVLNVLTASFNVTSSDGHVTVQISQVDGKITSLALTTLDIASAASLSLVEGRVTTAEGNISTNSADIAILQDAYAALTQSALVIVKPTDTWPVASPATSIIYRVVDRTNTPPQYYSDYMWNGTAMVLMAQYDNAIDPRPKKASLNLVTSGGVFDNMGALDVSELKATENPHTLAQYADLSAALAAIPTDYQKGGMSIKFVQSSDHKYVQYRLMKPSWSTVQADWQGVDDKKTDGSNNLLKSGGVYPIITSPLFNKVDGYLDGTSRILTYGTAQFSIIPIAPSSIIKLNVLPGGAAIAFAKSFAYNFTIPYSLDLATGGETTQLPDGEQTITAPSDANFLLLRAVRYDGYNVMPKDVVINGVTYKGILVDFKGGGGECFDMVKQYINDGYGYRGIASLTTNPSEPTGKVFYVATREGTYTHFGVTLTKGFNIIKYDGTSWNGEQVIGFGEVPTKESADLLLSKGAAENYGYYINNPEYLNVVLDSNKKIVEGVKPDGTKHITGDLQVDGKILNLDFQLQIADAKEDVIRIVNEALGILDIDALQSLTETQNPEYVDVVKDSTGKVIEGADPQGNIYVLGNLRVGGKIENQETQRIRSIIFEQLNAIEDKGQFTREIDINYINYKNGLSANVQNVSIKCSDNLFSFKGTASSNGGRLTRLSNLFLLRTGTYQFRLSKQATGLNFYIESADNVSVNDMRTSGGDMVHEFTVNRECLYYMGVNVTVGTTYNVLDLGIELVKKTTKIVPVTAYDAYARDEISQLHEDGFTAGILSQRNIGSWWDSVLPQKISQINTLGETYGANGFGFMFFTDYHQNSSNVVSPAIMKKIQNETSIQEVVFGGDLHDTYENSAAAIQGTRDLYKTLFKPLDILPVRGNHDINPYARDDRDVISDSAWYDIMLRPLEDKAVLHGMPYYYIDHETQHIRFIILDWGSLVHDPWDDGGVQAQWLKDRLTELSSEWGVIVFIHCMLTGTQGNPPEIDTSHSINAYNAINDVYDSLNCTLIAVVGGHTHVDLSMVAPKGYNIICTTCDSDGANASYDWNDPVHQKGTTNECAFDVFQISKTQRKIHLTRIGSGSDREFNY